MIREYVEVIAEVAATLEPGTEDISEREEEFEALIDRFEETDDPIRHGMATVMLSFLAGLFVGEEEYEAIRDNLDPERWFRLPKSHERRIHGHRHAGIRLVLEGPTLVHALDAHAAHPGPFSVDDLLPVGVHGPMLGFADSAGSPPPIRPLERSRWWAAMKEWADHPAGPDSTGSGSPAR